MSMLKKKIFKSLPLALAGGIAMVLLSTSQIFSGLANTASDALYQTPSAASSDIIIVGMDEASIEAYGSMPWSRDVIASAVEYLNADPQRRPAVIGLDALFVGESSSPQADAYLAEVCGEYGNVVTATSATFGSQLITDASGGFHTDEYSVLLYEEPYEALREATTQGQVNAMIDDDGILRHAIWQIELPDGRTIPSFHQAIYKLYAEQKGLDTTLVPPMDSLYRWYLPFQSAPLGFDDGFSVTQLVDGTLDPDIFADKIVLIGPFAQGMFDEYTTAIDHAVKMYGVEYQANALSALLRGEVKTEVLPLPQNILLFLIAIFCFLWFYERKILPSTIMWLGISVGWVLLCLLLWNLGYVVHVFYVPAAVTLSYIFSIAANYTRAALEKRNVIKTFSRYVAPQVVTELLNGEPKALQLGGKLADIVVLFVDIRGFTTMSEKLAPETVVEIVNKYLTLTSRCVFDNNGTLDKYVGDCTMAFWGAPLPQEDSIFKAVKAAMDMVSGAQELGEELLAQYGHTVQFGVGVHYGPAVVGNIGSPVRMDYTAIGDTVNTAARLESNAPAGCIYVSRDVADALQGRVEFVSLGTQIKLKGKSDNFEIFKVEGMCVPATEAER